jgi:S-adenosylhomocysteine hydrolase
MKTIKLILTLALLIPFVCMAQTNKNEAKTASSDKVEAYYFHFTSRCETCRTVESEAKQNIETLYPEMVKEGKMTFQAINLDDASSKTIAEKLQISGQTLLLVKGTKKINITNEGFMYARTNPAKFKSIIKEKVDGLLDL